MQEGVKRYGKWLKHRKNRDEWEFDYQFDSSGGNHQLQDFLTREERRQIWQAALRRGEIPSPGDVRGEVIDAFPVVADNLIDDMQDRLVEGLFHGLRPI